MGNNKNRKRVQAQKPRNEDWMRARVEHSNRNLTVPSGKAYKRPKAGSRNKEW